MKPYYEQEGVVLYHGDCRKILPTLVKRGGDLLLTDPPYGIKYASNHGASWEGTEISGDGSTDVRDWVVEHLHGLPMVVFGTWKVNKPAGVRGVLIWDKGPAFGMGDLSFPWKLSFEEIYIIGDGFVGNRDEGVLRGFVQVSWESKGRCHPNQKPVSLLRYLIRKTEASRILDPFAGSGSTLVAAKQLGREAVGIEIDERYCEVAACRLDHRLVRSVRDKKIGRGVRVGVKKRTKAYIASSPQGAE